MKIELSEEKDLNFFEESMYIVVKQKRIINNPNEKIYKINKLLKNQFAYIFLLLSLIIMSYIMYKEVIIIWLFSPFILIFILWHIRWIKTINKRKKEYLDSKNKSTLIINEEGIKLERSIMQNIETSWDNIKYILFSKNSISIIPNTNNSIIIFVNIIYKDKMIEVINKYNKGNLIKDNSDK